MRVHICGAHTPAGTDLTLTLTQVLGPTGRESKCYPCASVSRGKTGKGWTHLLVKEQDHSDPVEA